VSALDRFLGRQRSTRLALWDTATGEPLRQQMFPGEVRVGAWSADGKVAALAQNNGLALVEPAACRVRFRIPGTSAGGAVTISPNGRLVACRVTAGAGGKGGEGAVGV
jgi:hypothetical protein